MGVFNRYRRFRSSSNRITHFLKILRQVIANGQVESEGEMKNSTKNGAWTFYHSNGQLMKKVQFEIDL